MSVPSVTSAQSGPCPCTVKWASSTFGHHRDRSGPKSVITPSTALGGKLVWTVNVVVVMRASSGCGSLDCPGTIMPSRRAPPSGAVDLGEDGSAERRVRQQSAEVGGVARDRDQQPAVGQRDPGVGQRCVLQLPRRI